MVREQNGHLRENLSWLHACTDISDQQGHVTLTCWHFLYMYGSQTAVYRATNAFRVGDAF